MTRWARERDKERGNDKMEVVVVVVGVYLVRLEDRLKETVAQVER